MPTPPTTKFRKKSLFSCLALCGGLGLCVIPAHSQPPSARTEAIIDSVEQDWQNLRKSTGEKEFLDPQGTITAYQQFYEKEGYRSGQTAVEITGIIAQFYWQGLNNPQKALTIYDWGLQNFASFRGITNLKRGRAVVAEMGGFAQTYSLPLAENATPDLQNKTATLKPVIIDPAKLLSLTLDNIETNNKVDSHLSPALVQGSDDVGDTKVLPPVTLDTGKTPEITIVPTNNPFASVTVVPPSNTKTVPQNDLTVIPANPRVGQAGIQTPGKSTFSAVTMANPDSQTSSKVLSPVAPDNKNVIPANAGIQSISKSTFNPVTVSGAGTQTASTALSPVTPNNQNIASITSKELSIIMPPAPISSTSVSALVGIDPRQLALANAASAVRTGNLSIEDFFTQSKPTPQEALWMLSAPGVVISWDKDRPLRVALIGLIEDQAPQLLQAPEKLPQATQMGLGDYYDSQRSPKEEAIYQTLIKEKTPDGAWWPKLWVMNALAEYYGKIGEFDKAAQAKLAIQDQTTAESWVGNTYVEAARFYTQAGETEKAQALYEKAEKSTYGWAAGMALIDEGRALIAQQKFDEAIKLFSQPVQGNLAGQVSIALLAFRGFCYYRTGTFQFAIKDCQSAIDKYNELPNPLQGEGLDATINLSKLTLMWSKLWIENPIRCSTTEVRWASRKVSYSKTTSVARHAFRAELIVRCYKKVPLVISCEDSQVHWKIQAQQDDPWKLGGDTQSYYREWHIEVQAPSTMKKNAEFRISSPEFPQSVCMVLFQVKPAT